MCLGLTDLTDENPRLHGGNKGKKPSRIAEYKEVNFLTAERWLVKKLFHLTNGGYLISQPFIVIKPCFIVVSFLWRYFHDSCFEQCMNNAWKMNEPNFEFCRVTYTKES